MGYFGWKPYVPVAERRRQAEKAAAKATKAGATLSPVAPSRGAIAKTFWGKSWCANLERYSDFENRLPRGRTYVRNGSVIDLVVAAGGVKALVMGSSLYKVEVAVTEVAAAHWMAIGKDCSASIDSLVELLQGKLSKAVMERICQPGSGLFPAPKEIRFSCSCPDWASMCKHVAAVLYGVGARLDQQPELIFSLRGVDARDLVGQAGAGLPKSKKGPAKGKVLDDASLADVFGIEMVETGTPTTPAPKTAVRNKKAVVVKKTVATKPVKTVDKAVAVKKVSTVKPTPVKPGKALAKTAKSAATTTAKTARAVAGKAKKPKVADPKAVRKTPPKATTGR